MLEYELIDVLTDDGERGLAVLRAYLDESGTHDGAPLVVVGGFVADGLTWKSLTKEWRKKLHDTGMSVFHANDPECDYLREPFAKAILSRNLTGVAYSISREVYKQYASGKLQSQIGDAYAACAFVCAKEIGKLAKERNVGPVYIFYEAGRPNIDFIISILNAIVVEYPEWGICGAASAIKKTVIQLQTADFLSHIIGTNDSQWIEYFTGAFEHGRLDIQGLEEASHIVQRLLAKRRALRNRAKRELRRALEDNQTRK